jgi:CubicO group peptidase (beta-lactamase class C family)
VAGHAGLFGRGWEVFHLVKTLYSCYQGSNPFLGPPELIRIFLTPVTNSTRALGFDTPSAQEASCGRYFSPHSVGHLGFTGTSFWLDLELGQMVVFLTNRVHLGRDNDKIKPFRPRVHEAASKALGFSETFRK